MKEKNVRTISVNKSIKPINIALRVAPKLIINNTYYISFGMNEALPCTLLQIIEGGKIKVGIKSNSKIGYGDIHTILSTEIGSSPEEAVLNEQVY